MVIIYIIFNEKTRSFFSKKKTKDVDGRIEKKDLQQVSTLEKRNESAIITDYNTSFSLYVGINPTLIKRLRYVSIF